MLLDFRVLGPIEVWSSRGRVKVGGANQQALLAALVLGVGTTVPVERLAAVLWEGRLPASYRQQVYKRVHALRSVLGTSAIVTEESGYRLDLAPRCSDAHRFAEQVARARRIHSEGRPAEALEAFSKALSLWRRPALDGITSEVLRTDAARLDEQRAQVLRACADLEREQGEAGPPQDAEPPAAPACLPMDMPSFSGRTSQLEELDRVLNGTRDNANAVVINSISGTAGVGKTALAVHWAHRARHLFPDGQLYVNLRGFDPAGPMAPDAALTIFLRELGIPGERIPPEPDAKMMLYRSVVDGKRLLVVLDNAADSDQVQPLLPGSPTCFVVVTSRSALTGLVALHDAKRIALDVLSTEESADLLNRLLGNDRINTDPAAATALAELCGHLPLALRIAAANLLSSRHGSVADVVGKLGAGDRLTQLTVGGELGASVAAAFDLSYQAVRPATRRMLRLLGVAPGPDITTDAATALAGAPADDLLAELENLHLVEQYRPGRYRLHDLIRLYAQNRCTTEDSEAEHAAAVIRLVAFYLESTDNASAVLRAVMRTESRPRTSDLVCARTFADEPESLAWLQAEHQNLVAAVTWAHEHGADLLCAHLVDALRGYFWLQLHTRDWLTTGELGLASARTLAGPGLEAAMHRTLGLAHAVVRNREEALDHSTRAIELWGRLEDWEAAGGMHVNTAVAHMFNGRLDLALGHMQEALVLGVAHGSTRLQFAGLTGVTDCEILLGRPEQTISAADRLLQLAVDCQERRFQAKALGLRGWAQHELARFTEAEADFTAALRIHRQTGNRHSHAVTVHELGRLHLSTGEDDTAMRLLHQAVDEARDISEPRWESGALHWLAWAEHRRGDHESALRREHDALRIATGCGHTHVRIEALLGLTHMMLSKGQPDLAEDHARQALRLCDEHGWRVFLGSAHHALAEVCLATGRTDDARTHVSTALDLHRASGQRLREAQNLALLARIGS